MPPYPNAESFRHLLYLDFDGVLHPEDVLWHPKRGVYLGPKTKGGHVLFEHAPLLVDVLAPFPNVHIVLSTSWVRHRGFSFAMKRLPELLQRRVVGATYHSEMHDENWLALPRWQQILGDAGRRRPARWVSLEDQFEGWPAEHLDKLVQTDELLGLLRQGAVQGLRQRLDEWQSS